MYFTKNNTITLVENRSLRAKSTATGLATNKKVEFVRDFNLQNVKYRIHLLYLMVSTFANYQMDKVTCIYNVTWPHTLLNFTDTFQKAINFRTMKVALFFTLFSFAIAMATPDELPKIHIQLQKRSMNEIPSIDITFPDGSEDHLVLERHYMTEAERKANKVHCKGCMCCRNRMSWRQDGIHCQLQACWQCQ